MADRDKLIDRPLVAVGIGAGVAVLLGLALWTFRPSNPAAPSSREQTQGAIPTEQNFEGVLADNNSALRSGEGMVATDPLPSAVVPLAVVGLYTERARLTGNYDDYGRAEDLMARLQARFPASEGVCLAGARLHYALHRLAKAKQVLDGCPTVAGTAEDLGLRADIAFYSGRYQDARTIYRALVNQVGTPQTYIDLALFSAKTGAPGEALAFLDAAEQRYHAAPPLLLSWLALQRGLIELDRGRYDEARSMFALADERLPGYWLNEEHIAEATRLKGDAAGSKRLYEAVVRKTGLPEYLDALAGLEAAAGNARTAELILQRAEAIYSERARRFPEAIAGHALAHYLSAAPQPGKAMAMAEANFRNRPYGDAAIALAKADLLNDRPQDAARVIEQQLTDGWDTAEAYWILSLAAQAAGDPQKAQRTSLQALRRNPRSATQYAFAR